MRGYVERELEQVKEGEVTRLAARFLMGIISLSKVAHMGSAWSLSIGEPS
jgi:hypothetical protein